MAETTRAFTIKYNGLSDVLKSEVHISQELNPISPPQANSQLKKFIAIWDTGATGTAITQKVIQECGLKPVGMTQVHTAGGAINCNTYLVNVYLPNRVVMPDVKVTEVELVGDSDVLVGMDIINFGDFAVSNKDGKTAFTFRVPSIKKLDFVEEIEKARKKGKSGKPRRKKHPFAMKK